MTTKIYAVMDCDVSPRGYLIAGKEYLTSEGSTHQSFWVVNETGDRRYCLWHNCAHLDGGNWRRVEREDDGVTENMEEGYDDGLAGRENRLCSPNYCEGWERGWRERMLAWEETTND